jgi:hypothetical protein
MRTDHDRRARRLRGDSAPQWLRRIVSVTGFLLALAPVPGHAQPWSGLLVGSRAVDWSTAGVKDGIPVRTTICATLNPGATAAQINAAIVSCPAGQVVKLNPGTYDLGGYGLLFLDKSDVTLRGAGADQTKLVFSDLVDQTTDCTGGAGTGTICVRNAAPDNWTGEPRHTAEWTSGYAPGTTVITLANTAGLTVGSTIILDQQDDVADSGTLFVTTSADFTTQGSSKATRAGRGQAEIKTVTAINGNQVTISPGLYMPNWRGSQNPGGWWAGDTISGVGIEDLSIDNGGHAASSIFFNNALDCWVKGVRSITPRRNHVWIYLSARITVRDSYMYGTRDAAAESYGVETFPTSDSLIENNIFQHVAAPIVMNGPSLGTVVAYNFAIDNYYQPGGDLWMQPHTTEHDFTAMELVEGNDGQSFQSDNIHGTHAFQTLFRNFYHGDPDKTTNTTIVHLWSYSRYFNLIGNVLGRAGYYDRYETNLESTGTDIYSFGEPDVDSPAAPDAIVRATLMRWGNYDTVSGTVRFEPTEVPAALGLYRNPVPGTQALPASLYLSSKPAWLGTGAWPPIGPDVSDGNVPGYAGHANRIPARECYENTPKTDGILNFTAARCYGRPLPAPTNLRIIR